MDPLFERRELTRNVHLESRNLKRNIHSSLLAQLRHKYEGVCASEGYIQSRSITIGEYSLGRANLIRGGLDYVVKFQADVCLPHPGQVIRAPVSLKSKIGLHAEMPPLKLLIPRDLHIGNGDFETAEEGQDIEVEIVGARFQQGDESIVVLGKLLSLIQPAPPDAVAESEDVSEPMVAASVGDSLAASQEKRVVTVNVSSTKALEQAARRKRIRANPEAKTNESV